MSGNSMKREISAIFLFSAALLSLELSFTKFFSVVMWYHFGFLIVSTAMLGFAAAGIFLTFKHKKSKNWSLSSLINYSAIATLISYFLMNQVHYLELNQILLAKADSAYVLSRVSELFIMVILLFIPFFFMGLTISWIITQRKDRVGYYYGSNLIGSAVGAPLFLFIFNMFNGQVGVVINVLIILVSGFLTIRYKKEAILRAVLFAAIVPLTFFPELFPMTPPKDKMLGYVKNLEQDVEHTDWSSLSKVDFVKDPDRTIFPSVGLWGINQDYTQKGVPFPERIGVIIDSWAYTSIIKYPQDLSFYDNMPTTFVYTLKDKFKNSLHIGAGGGMDLLAAHHYGVESIKGVEINPVIVDVTKTKYDKYSGGIYSGKLKACLTMLSIRNE